MACLARGIFVLALNSIDPRHRGQFGVTKSDTIFRKRELWVLSLISADKHLAPNIGNCYFDKHAPVNFYSLIAKKV